jgi:site-specific recombinase XerD
VLAWKNAKRVGPDYLAAPPRLRHWYGSKLVADGTDLRTAQTLLRHVNLNATAIYVQVSDERRTEAIDRLNTVGDKNYSRPGDADLPAQVRPLL